MWKIAIDETYLVELVTFKIKKKQYFSLNEAITRKIHTFMQIDIISNRGKDHDECKNYLILII